MDFDIIKNTEDGRLNKNKFNKIIIFAVIIAILLLAFGKKGDKEEKPSETPANNFNFLQYKEVDKVRLNIILL